MGYKAKGDSAMDTSPDIIFDKDNFLPVFNQDIVVATKEIVIVSPFVRKRRAQQMMQHSLYNYLKYVKILAWLPVCNPLHNRSLSPTVNQ